MGIAPARRAARARSRGAVSARGGVERRLGPFLRATESVSGQPGTEDLPECLECGACCHTDDPRWLPVFGADAERFAASADALTEVIGGRRYLKIVEGRCVAHRAEGQPPRFVCSIYATRPDVCRALARGSASCRAAVRRHRGDAGSSRG